MTVADAIETGRFVEDPEGASVFVAPDRSRYICIVIRGDIQKDGVWMDVLTGSLSSLDAARPRVVTSLFTRALPATGPFVDAIAGPSALIGPGRNIPKWLSNESIALLWVDEKGHNQVFELNLRSNRLSQLTHERTDVVSFMLGANASLVYDVERGYSLEHSQAMIQAGYSVKTLELGALQSGLVDGTSLYDLVMCRRVVAIRANGQYQIRAVADSDIKCDVSQIYWGENLISPDGTRLIINRHVSNLPAQWSAYRGHFGTYRKDAEHDAHGFGASVMSELTIVDMASGAQRLLWGVPPSPNPWTTLAWSPDSKRLLVAPTMLPVKDSDSAALEGKAVAIVDAATGRYRRIAVDPSIAANIISTKWITNARVAFILRDRQQIAFDDLGGQWQRADAPTAPISADGLLRRSPAIGIDVRQGLNEPPVLVATELSSGTSRVVFDPNPNLLRRFALGRVEMTQWLDSGGHHWQGRLYYPAHYRVGVRYPLVIQTHGFARQNQFSIYGQATGTGVGLGPGWSVFLAQPLAGRDVAVLQIGAADDVRSRNQTDFELTKSYAGAFADATQHLVKDGLVDETKVGIMGHSASGRAIEDTLAFGEFRFAAAVADDLYELNYSQSMELGWDVDDGMPAPFGKDLAVWLDGSPAFNVERIQTPLQLILTSGSDGGATLLRPWEMFSRLRYLRKPVEYYVLPDLGHGSHLVQNPRQLLAVQNRTLDWWLFWLYAVEDPQPEKGQQYQDWRALRLLHLADLQRGRPAPRVWQSLP